MKWSWKVGTFAGISVYIHATFLMLVAWFVLVRWNEAHDLRGVVHGIVLVLSIFACVVLHEFGHALVARRFGIVTRDIVLLPIGGVSTMERIPDNPRQELWIALAGPLVSLAIAAGLFLFGWFAGLPTALSHVTQLAFWGNLSAFISQLMLANIVLAVFNLLPAFPMDGGRIFRALLARRMNYARATQVAATVGQGLAFFLGLLGLFTNPFLLLIALFVWIGAAQEATMAQMKSALAGVPVSQVTVTQFDPVLASDTLASVVQLMLHGTQQDFPVFDNGRLVGLLTRNDLVKALSSSGPDILIENVMRRSYPTVFAYEMLQAALDKLEAGKCHAVLVMDRGVLLGLFTLENLAEFIMVQSALSKSKQMPASKKEEPPDTQHRPRFIA